MAEITLNGKICHTIGELPIVGNTAPDFIVTKTDLSEIRLHHYLGKKIILNIFPSLDTSTCAAAMLQFDKIARQFPNIFVLCISIDLPFSQKRFCSEEHLRNVQPASVFRHPDFAKQYGVLITDGPLSGLLARSVVIIDEKGKIVYTQQISELSDEPNYSKLVEALESLEKNKVTL